MRITRVHPMALAVKLIKACVCYGCIRSGSAVMRGSTTPVARGAVLPIPRALGGMHE